MAKKYQAPNPIQKDTIPLSVKSKQPSYRLSNLIPLFFGLLYLGVHFVPDLGAYDAFGSQWLYIVIVDIIVILYILAKKNEYDLATATLFKNIFSKLYLVFFILAGLSTFTAINPTEAWVCYVRIIATLIAYFNIAILFQGRFDLFKWLAQMLGLILLVESFQTLSQFLNGVGTMDLSTLILSLKGTTGNKNIFAADLVVKIPFVIYCLHSFKLWGRIFNMGILILGAITIFIVNARASYVSLLLILIFYFTYCLLEYIKEKKLEQAMYRISYVLLPIMAAFFISQIEISNVKNLQEEKGGYGTVTERLASAVAFNAEDNQVRIRLWAHAIDYTKHHPLIGCGIGNWKIASIPYQKIFINDLVVPLHAHNDFVEIFAELGIPGGLLYLGLFVCILIFTIKVYRSNADEQTKIVSLFSFLAFIGYSIDAFFNFPIERPISQIFFAFFVALNVNAFINVRKEQKQDIVSRQTPTAFKAVFGLTAILFLLPAGYVTYLTYKSLVAQRIIIPDMDNEPLKLKWNEIIPLLPSIPNLSASGQPLDAIKGRYLMEAGKYEEALVLLNRAISANPVIAYSEFIKAGVFYKLGNMDSAYINASSAFYTKPRAKTYYQTLIAVLAKRKDTLPIQKAFEEAIRYRNEVYVWNFYILGMLNAQGKGSGKLLKLADSALRLFPESPDLLLRRKEVIQFMGTPVVTQKAVSIDFAESQVYYDKGLADFSKAVAAAARKEEAIKKEAYTSAAKNFLKAAEISPGNYIIYENAAIAYFNMGEFSKSLTYFNKVLALKTAVDGKTEYFTGVAFYNLGKKEEGCKYLQIALSKGWKEADAIIKVNCK